MYNKFDHIWAKLEVTDTSLEKACAEKLHKISWLLYLSAKPFVFESCFGKPSLPEYAFLIVAVLHTVVTNANHSSDSPDIRIGAIESFKRQNESSPTSAKLSDFVLKMIVTNTFSSQN